MISTPRKPTPIALQRRQPTCSPSIGTDSAATSSGVVNMIDEVAASCRWRSAKTLNIVDRNRTAERTICSFRFEDASNREPLRGISTEATRSEEHTSELPSLMRISYDEFCLK